VQARRRASIGTHCCSAALRQSERAHNEARVSICNHSAQLRAESLPLKIGPSTIAFASGSQTIRVATKSQPN
jgi:hypothetical protein